MFEKFTYQRHDLVQINEQSKDQIFARAKEVSGAPIGMYINLFKNILPENIPLIGVVRRYSEDEMLEQNHSDNDFIPIGFSSPFRQENGSRLRIASYTKRNEISDFMTPYGIFRDAINDENLDSASRNLMQELQDINNKISIGLYGSLAMTVAYHYKYIANDTNAKPKPEFQYTDANSDLDLIIKIDKKNFSMKELNDFFLTITKLEEKYIRRIDCELEVEQNLHISLKEIFLSTTDKILAKSLTNVDLIERVMVFNLLNI